MDAVSEERDQLAEPQGRERTVEREADVGMASQPLDDRRGSERRDVDDDMAARRGQAGRGATEAARIQLTAAWIAGPDISVPIK